MSLSLQENEFYHEDKVLATILSYGNEFLEEAAELISKDMFVEKNRRYLFTTMIEMNKNEEKIDLAALYSHVREKITPVYLSEIRNVEPAFEPVELNFSYHLRKVYENDLKRNLISKLTELVGIAKTEPNVYDALLKAEKEINDFEKNKRVDEKPISEEVIAVFDEIESQLHGVNKTDALKFTTLPSLNRIIGGIMPTDLIGIYGREKSTKSTLAFEMLLNLSIDQGIPTAIFSYEVSKDQLLKKAISMRTGIEYNKLRNPSGFNEESRLKENEFFAIKEKILSSFRDKNLIICDEQLNELEIQSRVKKYIKKFGVKLIVIDYLMLITPSARYKEKRHELNYLTMFFKQLAQKLKIAIVVISQANEEGVRAAEAKGLERDANYYFVIEKLLPGSSIKIKDRYTGEEYTYKFKPNDFLVKNAGIRHGEGNKIFVTSYRNNIYREVDTTPRTALNDQYTNYYSKESEPF
ncbi:MAG: hypothetical protein CMF23_14520 [Ignavibacteriae bacterium]|jgi:replicative DNA helicase|nr:hypothetical protein [Ignavibacteriota bacterium]